MPFEENRLIYNNVIVVDLQHVGTCRYCFPDYVHSIQFLSLHYIDGFNIKILLESLSNCFLYNEVSNYLLYLEQLIINVNR